MQIKTLLVTEYEGEKVYIRNFGETFEYLVVCKGEIYTMHIVVTKKPIQWLLGKPYTKKQNEDVCKYLLTAAQTTIDFLKKEGKG